MVQLDRQINKADMEIKILQQMLEVESVRITGRIYKLNFTLWRKVFERP